MISELHSHQHLAVKKSFFNILAFLLEHENIDSRYIRCLLKWGLQLDLSKEDLVISNMDPDQIRFTEPRKKVESIFHLVYLIYMDNMVEDVELEVAALYSERLGFKPEIIGDLIESVASLSRAANNSPEAVQERIEDFLKEHS
jgi:hypothetical protein